MGGVEARRPVTISLFLFRRGQQQKTKDQKQFHSIVAIVSQTTPSCLWSKAPTSSFYVNIHVILFPPREVGHSVLTNLALTPSCLLDLVLVILVFTSTLMEYLCQA